MDEQRSSVYRVFTDLRIQAPAPRELYAMLAALFALMAKAPDEAGANKAAGEWHKRTGAAGGIRIEVASRTPGAN